METVEQSEQSLKRECQDNQSVQKSQLIEKAFFELFNKSSSYTFILKYNNRFSDFNANIRKLGNVIEINASSKWRPIGDEIQIGLIQSLLMKVFKKKKDTFYTELYAEFIKNLGKYTVADNVDPFLKKLFDELNEEFFDLDLDLPNLRWGKNSVRQLGLYNYHNDTITISSIFKDFPDVTKFIMYHELLHKDEQFSHKKGRSHHHTSRFRQRERSYPGFQELEEKINRIVRSYRRHKSF